MSAVATDLGDRILLNDGVNMPMFGFGTYLCKSGMDGEAERAVLFALETGYRMIDTAEFYHNETDVGRAIAKSGINREDIFIVTKVWEHGYEKCMQSLQESLKKLQVSYVDLYLIHHPLHGDVIPTYNAMLQLQKDGLIRSVGVANFGVHHLKELEAAGLPAPSVNQIQVNPFFKNEHIVQCCREKNIAVMGYSPLIKGQKLSDANLIKIAQRYNRSVPQLLIRWGVQNGYITIPKSTKIARILENTDVFDWSITEEDMSLLQNSMPSFNCTWDPTEADWCG